MPPRSGLGAQLAVAKETTYGTRVAPNRALPINNEDLAENPEFFKSEALRAGQMARGSRLHRRTTKTVGGGINMEMLNEGMGWLPDQLHGNVVAVTTPVGATNARKQVHQIGLEAPWGKSLSVQVGRPGVDGVVRPFDYLGCKVLESTIACEKGGAVTVAASIDGREEKTDQTLVVATYDTDAEPYVFPDLENWIAGAEVLNVQSITWKVGIPHNTERFALGTDGLKKQPIANGLVDITADAVLEFETMADHNRFKNEDLFALKTRMQGDIIEGVLPYYTELNSPCVKQVSSGPAVEGPDIITVSASFEILADGTNAPLTIEMQNTDTAVV